MWATILWDIFMIMIGASLGVVIGGMLASGKVEDLYCKLDAATSEIARLRRELASQTKRFYPPLKLHSDPLGLDAAE